MKRRKTMNEHLPDTNVGDMISRQAAKMLINGLPDGYPMPMRKE
jgi:hypothetical protein